MPKTVGLTKKQKSSKNKRLEKILGFAMSLAISSIIPTMTFGITSCSKTEIKTTIFVVDDKGEELKTVNVTSQTTSSGLEITLTPKEQGKKISSISKITINNKDLKLDSDYTFNQITGTITIKKDVIDSNPGEIRITPVLSDITISEIKLSKTTHSMKVTENFKISASLTYASNETISWRKKEDSGDGLVSFSKPSSTSGEEIEVTATKAGSLVIEAFVGSITAECLIEITEIPKEIVDLDITPSKTEWDTGSLIKASDLTVKGKYSDGSFTPALTWSTDYSISSSVGGTPIANFDTTGFTFSTVGSQLFEVTYLQKATIKKTFNVTVIEHQTTQAEFLAQYTQFYQNYNPTATHTKTEFVFDNGGTIKGSSVTKATIGYETSGLAKATFDDSSLMNVAGQTTNNIKTHLDNFDSTLHDFSYSISDNEISYTVSLKSDSTKYETVKFDNKTYVTDIVNTFTDQTYLYADTTLKNILYADSSFFTVDTGTGYISMTDAGKNETGTVLVPEKFNNTTIQGTDTNSFKAALLSNVRFVNIENIITIGDDSFNSCINLTSFTVPDNVGAINTNAFAGCKNLKEFTINPISNLKQICTTAFTDCIKLEAITLPASVITINQEAFSGSSFKSIDLSASSKRWLQTGITSPVALDVSNSQENATKLVTGSWKDSGIEIEKQITSFNETGTTIFTTNLSSQVPVSSLNPTLTFNAKPLIAGPLSGIFTFTYNDKKVSVDAIDIPTEGQDLTIDLTNLFTSLEAGKEITVDVTQKQLISVTWNDGSNAFNKISIVEPGVQTIELVRNAQTPAFSNADIYVTINGGTKTKLKENVDLTSMSEGAKISCTLASAVTTSLTIDIEQHIEVKKTLTFEETSFHDIALHLVLTCNSSYEITKTSNTITTTLTPNDSDWNKCIIILYSDELVALSSATVTKDGSASYSVTFTITSEIFEALSSSTSCEFQLTVSNT